MIKTTNTKLKIVSRALFFFVLAILALWTANRFLRQTHSSLSMKASPQKKFMSALDLDLEHLEKNKTLPPGFFQLNKVDLVTDSKDLREAFNKYPIKLRSSPQGKFNLHIFADSLLEGGVMIQYDLVEIKSGNTIWEMGRTFPQSL